MTTLTNLASPTISASSLAELRGEIDRIDDGIHDLLMQRTTLVDVIRARKQNEGGPIIQPVRETSILARLAARHNSRMPFPAVVRIWREIISAMTLMQHPVSVAVLAPDGMAGPWDLARDHFGSQIPMQALQSFGQVLRAVAERDSVLGVLPLPYDDDPDPWWLSLIARDGTAPQIIERLSATKPDPRTGQPASNARNAHRDVLVIARQPVDPTALAKLYFVLELPPGLSRARLLGAIARAGIECDWLISQNKPDFSIALAAFAGPIAPGDPRLSAIAGETGIPIDRMYAIGGHPGPVSPPAGS